MGKMMIRLFIILCFVGAIYYMTQTFGTMLNTDLFSVIGGM